MTVWVVAALVGVGGLLDESYPADVGRYADFGRAMADGDLPYRDFYTEYPPLALPLFLLPALISEEHYNTVFEVGIVLVGLVAIAGLAAVLRSLEASTRRSAVALGAVATLPLTLGHVVMNRYDLWPA